MRDADDCTRSTETPFVAILGRWTWSLPHRPARILRGEPSPAQPAASA